MISDEGRREVAKSLRYISQHPPEWATSACAIAEVFDADYPLWADSGELFSVLADLIDRPMTHVDVNEHGRACCANCGCDDWCLAEGNAHFCPECGAEVASE